MTTTVYIDANRTNCSVKSNTNKNEWTYKLASPIQIPSGSEIAVQDSFIHKKGINGASIEINEDIEEEVNFFYYLSDNPHFLPGSVFGADQITTTPQGYLPTFYPVSPLYSGTVDKNDPNAGTGLDGSGSPTVGDDAVKPNTWVYGKPLPSQRRELFSYKSANSGAYLPKPFATGGASSETFNTMTPVKVMSDPYLMGYSEMPMMAVQVGNRKSYNATDDTFDVDNGDAYINRINDGHIKNDLQLYNLRNTLDPANNTDYFAGGNTVFTSAFTAPYEATFNGFGSTVNGEVLPKIDTSDRILRPKTGRVKIFIPKGVYSVNEIAQFVDDYFNGRLIAEEVKKNKNFDMNINKKNLNLRNFNGKVSTDNKFSTESVGGGVFTQVEPLRRYGTIEIDKIQKDNVKGEYFSTTYPLGDVRNDPYAFSHLRQKATPTKDNKGVAITPATDTRLYKNRHLVPEINQTLYVPVHRFNDIVKISKYGRNSKLYGTQTTYNPTGSKLDKPDNRIESITLNRWGFQCESALKAGHNGYGKDIKIAHPEKDDLIEAVDGKVIGLHCKVDVSTYPAMQANKQVVDTNNSNGLYDTVGIYPDNYAYNPMRSGYYLGTPDFSFTYDGDSSAFQINGLHQSCRIPSVDMTGNTMTDSGNEVSYLKRPCDLFSSNVANQFIFETVNFPVDTDPTKALNNMNPAKQLLKGASNPEERVGGICIHNWALETARRLGDVDFNESDENGETYGHRRFRGDDDREYDLEEPENYYQVYNFNDFFSTEQKARDAWETTIWFRLGFSYDALQNDKNYEPVAYYDMQTDATSFNTSRQAPKIFTSQGVSQGILNESYFFMPGITTRSQLDISLVPQVSTTYNNKNFLASLQQRYTNDDKGSGGQKLSGSVAQSRRGLSLPKTGGGDTIFRMYDNHDVNNVYYPYSQNFNLSDNRTSGYSLRSIMLMNASSADYGDTTLNYSNSMYRGCSRGVVETTGLPIVAQGLPSLSKQGYYIITSDIVDGGYDDIKQGQPLPILGIVPISNLSNQDFITNKNTITHITNQSKVLNAIRVKILNPDLTAPILEDNSSILLAITMPLPQQTPLQSNLDDADDDDADKKKKNQQPNPYENKTGKDKK